MSTVKKIFERIVAGGSDENLAFEDLRRVLRNLGFDERVRGGHFLFTKNGVTDLINIQREGSNMKGYQVRQIRSIIKKYNLKLD